VPPGTANIVTRWFISGKRALLVQ